MVYSQVLQGSFKELSWTQPWAAIGLRKFNKKNMNSQKIMHSKRLKGLTWNEMTYFRL